MVNKLYDYLENAGASRPTDEETTIASVQRLMQLAADTGCTIPCLCPTCRTLIKVRPVAAQLITDLIGDISKICGELSLDLPTTQVDSAGSTVSELGLAALFQFHDHPEDTCMMELE